jgi:hypothetical protein
MAMTIGQSDSEADRMSRRKESDELQVGLVMIFPLKVMAKKFLDLPGFGASNTLRFSLVDI